MERVRYTFRKRLLTTERLLDGIVPSETATISDEELRRYGEAVYAEIDRKARLHDISLEEPVWMAYAGEPVLEFELETGSERVWGRIGRKPRTQLRIPSLNDFSFAPSRPPLVSVEITTDGDASADSLYQDIAYRVKYMAADHGRNPSMAELERSDEEHISF